MAVEQYAVVSIEEDQIVPISLGNDLKSQDRSLEDIKTTYPIGIESRSAFEQTQWLIGKDGTVVVQLPRPRMSKLENLKPKPEILSLFGTLTRQHETLHVHTSGQGDHGLAITLDGLLIAHGNGYLLKCIYTAQIRGAQHVEQLTLRLGPTANPLPLDLVNSTLTFARQRQTLEEQPKGPDSPLLSEPDMYIGGVPVPMGFNVTISGKVDDSSFKFENGTLLLRNAGETGKPTVSLVLGTIAHPVILGWSSWATHEDLPLEPETPSESISLPDRVEDFAAGHALREPLVHELFRSIPAPGVAVTAEGGHIRVAITPTPPFRPMNWWSRDPNHPEDLASVHVDNGNIDLLIEDDKISGSIEAKGYILAGSRPDSTFKAKVKGQRQGAKFLETITRAVSPRRFSGRWQTQQFGELTLTQEGQTVHGNFSRGGMIEGNHATYILNFDWADDSNGSGRGFLRATGRASLLVGMRWLRDKPTASESIIAVQKQPTINATDTSSKYPPPTNDEEALGLRFIGYDLAAADKHREAAKMLTEVVNYYYNRDEPSINPGRRHSYRLNQALPLVTLIDSAFKAGEYQLLVDALDKAMELHRVLSKDTSSMLLFREQVDRYTETLRKTVETMRNLAEAFERGLYTITGAGIGVSIEELSGIGGVKITSVDPNMPAGRAGVMESDQLVAIDGVATTSMKMDAVLSRLRGPAGSGVTLTLLRGEHRLKVELVREPLAHIKPARRQFLVETWTALRDEVATLQRRLTDETEAVNRLLQDAAEPLSALDDLAVLIANLQAELPTFQTRIVASAKKAMADTPNLNLFQRFADLLQKQAQNRGRLDPEDSAAMMALDREFDEVERRAALDLDASMLGLSSLTLGSVMTLQQEVAARHRLVVKLRKTVEQAPTSRETQERLASLTKWLDRWWSQLVTDPGKIDALEQAGKVYDHYVQLLVEYGLPEKALIASELGRARAFVDLLASRNATALSATVRKEALTLPSSAKAPSLTIDEIRNLILETDTTVLDYYVLDDALLIWVLAPPALDNTNNEKVAIYLKQVHISRSELEALAMRFSWLVAAPTGAETLKDWEQWLQNAPSGAEVLAKDITASLQSPSGRISSANAKVKTEISGILRKLYDILIAPVTKHLLDRPNKTVTVVPHGYLFLIPFAALSKPKDAQGGGDQYLIEDHALTYVPSLSVMQAMLRTHRSTVARPHNLLAVVDPEFGADVKSFSGTPFPPLPKWRSNIRHVTQYYQEDKTLLGPEATRKTVLAEAESYDVVLFGTHAEALAEPEESYIALADDHLRIKDIADQRFKAQLVILGACETGRGRITSDGVEGLARMVIASGADSLLASLWGVPEMPTLQLIVAFHEAWLERALNMPAALREAQLELLLEYPGQVSLWAGFIVTGGWL